MFGINEGKKIPTFPNFLRDQDKREPLKFGHGENIAKQTRFELVYDMYILGQARKGG